MSTLTRGQNFWIMDWETKQWWKAVFLREGRRTDGEVDYVCGFEEDQDTLSLGAISKQDFNQMVQEQKIFLNYNLFDAARAEMQL